MKSLLIIVILAFASVAGAGDERCGIMWKWVFETENKIPCSACGQALPVPISISRECPLCGVLNDIDLNNYSLFVWDGVRNTALLCGKNMPGVYPFRDWQDLSVPRLQEALEFLDQALFLKVVDE